MGFILNRLGQGGILVAAVCVLSFLLFSFSPGDPSNLYFGPGTKRETMNQLRHSMGVDEGLTVQFLNWASRIIKGDFGYSFLYHRPVSELLREVIPATLQLTACALVINVILGFVIGGVMGLGTDRLFGRALDALTLGIYSIPTFCLALFFIYLFSLELKWFPSSGMTMLFASDLTLWQQMLDRMKHVTLPAFALGLVGAAATSRYVRNATKQAMNQPYILLARAKGLDRKRVYLKHILRNSLIPVVTMLGIYFPFLLSGALVIEVVFAWPGMGRVTYEAMFAKDYPVILAVNIITAVLVVTGNLISDITYRFIDPRIKVG